MLLVPNNSAPAGLPVTEVLLIDTEFQPLLLSIHVTKGGDVMTSFFHSVAHVRADISNFICFVRVVISCFIPRVEAGTPAPDPNEGYVDMLAALFPSS